MNKESLVSEWHLRGGQGGKLQRGIVLDTLYQDISLPSLLS